MFSAALNNISAISWRSVLLVKETRVPGEKYWPVTSHWQTLSHNVVFCTLDNSIFLWQSQTLVNDLHVWFCKRVDIYEYSTKILLTGHSTTIILLNYFTINILSTLRNIITGVSMKHILMIHLFCKTNKALYSFNNYKHYLCII